VQGRVESSTENSGKRINLTIKGESFQTATTTTDEFGRFWISYNPDIATNDGVVQLHTEDSEVKVSEVFSEFYDEYSALDSGTVALDSVTITNLVSRSVNSQIQFAYQKQQKLDPEQRLVYTRDEALVYYLKDYKRFSSVRDLFIELTIYVGVSKLEESDKMFVRVEELPEVTDANLPPLILLDGLRTDSRTILNQSPNDIEKIEVIPSHYFVNDMVYRGVISVHTFGRAKSPPPPSGFTYSLANHQPYTDLGHEVTLADHLPLYESNLLWDPIYAHQGGELVLEFATSRLEGRYQAIITGITKSGKPVNITRYFQTKAANQ